MTPISVWCAGGSGTLAKALGQAWPHAYFNVVAVGKRLEIEGAKIIQSKLPFCKSKKSETPVPTHPNYERKAWAEMMRASIEDRVLFWNVSA